MFPFGEARSVKLMGSLSASCIVLSHALKRKFRTHIEESKISVIYPSMHIAVKKNASSLGHKVPLAAEGVFRCVIVGQVAQGKRQEDAIRAIGTLAEWGIATELVIVGGDDPSCRRRLEETVSRMGLRERVTFVGQVPNALPFIASADALLMCSRCEAFGRVTIEGMLAGKPVIGARSGATEELIQDGRTGLLYTVGDPHDLASKIRKLCEDRQYAERLGLGAQRWVATVFNKQRYLTEMLPILEVLHRSSKSEHSDPVLADARSAHGTHEVNS
jgi:glycosyltransferase involved in cell wall biosynthesis